MKATMATEIGTRVSLRIYWGDNCSTGGCHNAMKHLKDTKKKGDWKAGGEVEKYPGKMWPTKCDHCQAPIGKDHNKQVFRQRLYDTPSGKLEPGNIFWNTWLPDNMFWDNHKGPHLSAILPNGNEWNIDSRASNCGSPNDRTHRCWVRHGEPPLVHVNKNGHTCTAGAGSIASGNYHGFLHHGEFKL